MYYLKSTLTDDKPVTYKIISLNNGNANAVLQGPIAKIAVDLSTESLRKFSYEIVDGAGNVASIDDVVNWWESQTE